MTWNPQFFTVSKINKYQFHWEVSSLKSIVHESSLLSWVFSRHFISFWEFKFFFERNVPIHRWSLVYIVKFIALSKWDFGKKKMWFKLHLANNMTIKKQKCMYLNIRFFVARTPYEDIITKIKWLKICIYMYVLD